jgi:hypothetical protein
MIADAKHPIWSLIRLAIVMVSLTIILYLCASQFDQTEIQTLVWAFIAIAGGEGLSQLLGRLTTKPKD